MPNKGRRNLFNFFTNSFRKRSPKLQTPTNHQRKLNSSSSSNSNIFQPKLEEMKWVFSKYDSDKDGKISFEEFRCAERAVVVSNYSSNYYYNNNNHEEAAAKCFAIMDSDGDGFLDFKEFVELYTVLSCGGGGGGGKVVDEFETAFKVYDSNGDGKISAEEVLEIMKRIGERFSLNDCKQMVKNVDGDGDGFINIHEFTRMMTSSNSLTLNYDSNSNFNKP